MESIFPQPALARCYSKRRERPLGEGTELTECKLLPWREHVHTEGELHLVLLEVQPSLERGEGQHYCWRRFLYRLFKRSLS